MSTKRKGEQAANMVEMWMRLNQMGSASFLVLAGYSRGGAAVIHACNVLLRKNITVDCLLLFDAVDRTMNLGGVQQIPENVRCVYHARRHDDTKSRGSFDNCGTSMRSSASIGKTYHEKFFYGTHGAIGGVPHILEDELFQARDLKPVMPDPQKTLHAPLPGRTLQEKHNNKRRQDTNIREAMSIPKTTVSYAQDEKVALQVGHWMRSGLQAAKTNHNTIRSGNVGISRQPLPEATRVSISSNGRSR